MLLIGLEFRLYAVRENLRAEPESLRGHLNIADRIVCVTLSLASFAKKTEKGSRLIQP
jgi:hypothetical protein